MGSGSYSSYDRSIRADKMGFFSKSSNEIFSQRSINNAMSPYNIGIRESRDSKEHPESLAIIIALDLTGSMGSIPHYLVKNGLPNIMEKIIQSGIADPQVLFIGVGDHECDQAPLQVGQFESSDELLDKWLTTVYLEGGGGGNAGESYLLAWYFASKHTSLDCFEKRGQKGFLFTIGDEPTLKSIPASTLKKIMGNGQFSDVSDRELLDESCKMYNVFHIHMTSTRSGERGFVQDGWKQLMSDNVIMAEKSEDVSRIISEIVVKNYKKASIIPVINIEVTNDPVIGSVNIL